MFLVNNSVLPRTLLNSVMRFHKVALKQLHQNKIEKHPEKTYAVEFSLNTNASGSLPGKSSQ